MMMIYTKSIVSMDTIISIKIVTSLSQTSVEKKIDQAFSAYRAVETICSQLDPQSEVMRLQNTVETSIPVSRDAFSTAVFVQGHKEGLETLEKAEVDGILITSKLDKHLSKHMKGYFYE